MAVRTKPDSVLEAGARHPEADALEAELGQLSARHPGAALGRYLGAIPTLAEDAYLAPTASLIGDVRLGPRASVWFGCVLRGDLNFIEIGPGSNIQDGTVIHVGDDDPCVVGADVVVGHRAVLHACTIGAGCLIGIGAIVLDGARLGEGCVVGAGALVTAGLELPAYSLILGAPARVVRAVRPEDRDFPRRLAAKYRRLAHNHRAG